MLQCTPSSPVSSVATQPKSKLDSRSQIPQTSTEEHVPKRANEIPRGHTSLERRCTQLQFYTRTWVDILELARRTSLVCCIRNELPERDNTLESNWLLETSTTYTRKRKGSGQRGCHCIEWLSWCWSCPNRLLSKYEKEMSILWVIAFAASSTIHNSRNPLISSRGLYIPWYLSRLKPRSLSAIKSISSRLGSLVGGCGQAEYNEYVTRHVRECIDKCAFLHDGEDDQVRYWNSRLNFTNDVLLGQKKITSTIVRWETFARSSITVLQLSCTLFPEVFGETYPTGTFAGRFAMFPPTRPIVDMRYNSFIVFWRE